MNLRHLFYSSVPTSGTNGGACSPRTVSARKRRAWRPSLEGVQLEPWTLLSGVTLITHAGGAAALAAIKKANLFGNVVAWDLPKRTTVDNLGGVTLNITAVKEITSLRPLTLVNGGHTLFNFLPGSTTYLHSLTIATSGVAPALAVNGGTLTTQNLTLHALSTNKGTGIFVGAGGDYGSDGATNIVGYGTGISVVDTGTITDTWNPKAASPADSIVHCAVGVNASGSGFVGIDYTNIVSCGVGLQDDVNYLCFFNAGSFVNDGVAVNLTLSGTYSYGDILNTTIDDCGTAAAAAVSVVMGSTSYFFLSQVTITPAKPSWQALIITGGNSEIQSGTVQLNGAFLNNGSVITNF